MEEIEAAAHAARADELIEKLPQHYRTVIGDGGARLSVGEKQRINLARAFLKDAPILLMDEPTSALDVESEAQVVASLFALMRGRTTLMVAHRLTTIRRVDKILVVDNGRLTEMGAPEDLLAEQGYYARVVGGQLDLCRSSPHAPLALSGFALSLLALALSRGLLALPSRCAPSSPRPRSGRPSRARPTAARARRRLGRLDGPRQARIGALEVLLHGREGLAELLPLRPSAPHSLVTTSRYSPCSLYTSVNAFASPDAFSAASARLWPCRRPSGRP